MPKNQSDVQKKEAPRFDFPPEVDEEEMRVLEHNLKAIKKGIDLKKLMSMANRKRKRNSSPGKFITQIDGKTAEVIPINTLGLFRQPHAIAIQR